MLSVTDGRELKKAWAAVPPPPLELFSRSCPSLAGLGGREHAGPVRHGFVPAAALFGQPYMIPPSCRFRTPTAIGGIVSREIGEGRFLLQ